MAEPEMISGHFTTPMARLWTTIPILVQKSKFEGEENLKFRETIVRLIETTIFDHFRYAIGLSFHQRS
jgi:hypothetical protein